jgi:hypothetical protein
LADNQDEAAKDPEFAAEIMAWVNAGLGAHHGAD